MSKCNPMWSRYIGAYISLVGGVGDYSSDSAGVQPGSGEGELEEEVQGEMDSVLLFDEKTDSFQLFREGEDRVGSWSVSL